MEKSTASNSKPKRSELTTEEKIQLAEARIKRLRKEKTESTRKIDTRRKVIAGAALLKAFEMDSDLKGIVLPALQVAINPQDFNFAFGGEK